MYYKLIENNIIIDVSSEFMSYTPHCKFVGSSITDANFLFSDITRRLYSVDWLPRPVHDVQSVYKDASAIEISQEEYKELREKLTEGISIPADDNEILNDSIDEDAVYQVENALLNFPYLYEKVRSLETELEQQKQQNAMLEECILELSTTIYS